MSMPDEKLESVEAALAAPGKGLDGGAPQQAGAPKQATATTPAGTPATTTAAPVGQAKQSEPMKAAMAKVKATLTGLNSGTVRGGGLGGGSLAEIYQRMRGGGGGTQPGTAATPIAPTPQAGTPGAPTQFTVARSAIGKAQTSGYDYGGMRIEMPEDFDMNNTEGVQAQVAFSNQMADWLNEDEED